MDRLFQHPFYAALSNIRLSRSNPICVIFVFHPTKFVTRPGHPAESPFFFVDDPLESQAFVKRMGAIRTPFPGFVHEFWGPSTPIHFCIFGGSREAISG